MNYEYPMTTQFVGLKEFRQNLATYTTKVASQKTRLIILKKNRPVFEVRGLDERTFSFEQLACDISQAREDVKRGRLHTTEHVRKHLGVKKSAKVLKGILDARD